MIRAAAVVAALGGCAVVPAIGTKTSTTSATPTSSSSSSSASGTMPDGIAGKVCDREGVDHMRNDHGYEGPCWDPPGYRIASLMPGPAIRGRREVAPGVWWFEMPDGEVNPNTSCVQLPGAKADFTDPYEPYGDGGFTPFTVGDLQGKPLDEVLDWIDSLDQPACVHVQWDPQCDDGHGKVCFQSAYVGDPVTPDGGLQLIVGTDVIDAGTPDEQRRLPYLVDRPLDEALAELAKLGFTAVEVIERNVPCERGVVCEALPDGGRFHGPAEPIQLVVRNGSKR